MKILAIDTSTEACSVAILKDGKVYTHFDLKPQKHGEVILDMIESVCRSSELSLDDIDVFAYGKGPGSFTGLRIAASVLQGLAFAKQKPAIGISTLQALAQQSDSKQEILASLDARMGEIYWGIYKKNQVGIAIEISKDSLCEPSQISLLANTNYVGVGSGCIVYEEVITNNFENITIDQNIKYPHAKDIVLIAESQITDGTAELLKAEEIIPVYIRNKVVK